METPATTRPATQSRGPIEKFVPMYFGPQSALYGCFHTQSEHLEGIAVLICQSVGHEYERCHRAMRQLAVQSVRKGLAALRFDYYGTGDSAGSTEEATLATMRRDIELAAEACKAKTRANRLALVGIRLGATLAAQVACLRTDIESLVLYAPVLDGNNFLAEWRREQGVFDSKHSHASRQARINEILGFSVTDAFQKELNREFLPAIANTSLKRVLLLVNEADAGSVLLKHWLDELDSHGIIATVETPDNLAIWQTEADEATVPIKIIRRILAWLKES